ncbi:DUF4832 domain-containing protein [Luteolibacter yonseiensis]
MATVVKAEEWKAFRVKPTVAAVQPMTGLVLWSDSEHAATAPIQLEFCYLPYSAVMKGPESYDWTAVDRQLAAVAKRKHQAILRFWDTYPAKPSGVPAYIRNSPGWRGKTADSEGEATGFPDWGNAAWQEAHLAFFKAFAARYDKDPRLAFLQCGFGLWSEYHIYDGPFESGLTFPDRAYQARFLNHMAACFKQTHWMISIDAADAEIGPFLQDKKLKSLPFGLFDDSFLAKEHPKVNAPRWKFFGADRWQTSPGGGELSYYNDRDQREALSKKGPNGESLESASARFHTSFMIGNDQPQYADMARIGQVGRAMGYRFRLDSAKRSAKAVKLTFSNTGVAPIYYDAYPAYAGAEAKTSLKGLLPGQKRTVVIPTKVKNGNVTIRSTRLVPGQKIGFSVK